MEPTEPARAIRSGPQSRIPTILIWIAAGALAFRIVTVFTDRGRPGGEQAGEAGLVRWQPVAEAPRISANAGKPVLYDFTAAWCLPCHRLDSEAWSDPEIAKSIGDRFVPARVVDRLREDGRNAPAIEELLRRYSVEAFPTLVVADGSGREIARMQGYAGRDRLLEFLSDASRKAGR